MYQPKDARAKRNPNLMVLLVIVLVIALGNFLPMYLKDTGYKAENIKQIELSQEMGLPSRITDAQTVKTWLEAFNQSKNVETVPDLTEFAAYTISLEGTQSKYSDQLTLYVDKTLEHKKLYWNKDEQFKKVDEKQAAVLLVHPLFDGLYSQNRPPEVTVSYKDGQDAVLPAGYEWNVKKTDDAFHPVKTDFLKGDAKYSFPLGEPNQMNINAGVHPDSIKLDIYQNGMSVLSTNQEVEPGLAVDKFQPDLSHLGDGLFNCSMELTWNKIDGRTFNGKAVYEFDIQVDLPPTFEVSSTELYPGELLIIKASHINPDEAVTIKSDINFKPNIFGEGSEKTILLPVSYYHAVNKTYTVTLKAGSQTQDFKVKLLDKEFVIQYLTIDPKVAAATRNNDSAVEMQKKVYPLKPVSDPEKYWEGSFIQPVEGGRVTPTDFGKRRYVNDAPTSYRHNGLDIGADKGTPVMASNNGRVLFAGFLIETGNTVIIEHGYGLKTWYFHMDSLKTEEGVMVKKGDVIGLVGSTGFSTAPHLHFSFSVNDVWLNPMTILESGIPLT